MKNWKQLISTYCLAGVLTLGTVSLAMAAYPVTLYNGTKHKAIVYVEYAFSTITVEIQPGQSKIVENGLNCPFKTSGSVMIPGVYYNPPKWLDIVPKCLGFDAENSICLPICFKTYRTIYLFPDGTYHFQ